MNERIPEWLFDESVQVGVDYTGSDLVNDYDKEHEGFRDFEKEVQRIVNDLGLSKDSTVLDIGCGTGGLSTHLARLCKHVYSVDVSAEMISVLEDKIRKQGLDNISTAQAGFLKYKHEGESPDAIIANITLHHLPDFWKQIALCRFYDILKPGGMFFLADVVFGFDPRSYQAELDCWVDKIKELAGQNMADETVVHIRDEFSTWSWIMKGMLERAGFRIESCSEVMPNMQAYVCLKQGLPKT